MSNTYLTGEKTKRKILKESKKLFFKNGFTDTTYDDISNAAKVNRALIPYHFKSKQVLGQEIYCNIIDEFSNTINDILDIDQFSPDFVSILHFIAYFRLLGNNSRLSRFVFQLLTDGTDSVFSTEKEKELLLGFGSKFSQLQEEEQAILVQLNIGMKKESVRMIYFSNEDTDIDQIARMNMQMLLGYAGYSKRKADELIAAAFEVINLFSFHVKSGFTIEIKYN